MLLITQSLEIQYLQTNRELKLEEVINLKRYTVSDTPLSYRQANDLDSNNLLDNERKNKLGWRKFSYKELVYVEIVVELKEFGIKSEHLKPLWEAFFKEPKREVSIENLTTKSNGEIAIGCVFAGVEMTLFVDTKGFVLITDPQHLIQILTGKSQIRISLSEIINRINAQVGLPTVPINTTLQSIITNNFSRTTPKESELLEIIRDKSYVSVSIKKKDGTIAFVRTEKYMGKNEITPSELQEILKTKDYLDMNIIKRDGKIVNYKLEETIKL